MTQATRNGRAVEELQPPVAALSPPLRRGAFREDVGARRHQWTRAVSNMAALRMPSSEIALALEHRRDLAVPHHRDAVGDVDQLRQVARIEEDGVALGGELAHQLEDLALGADIDAARRVVEEEDARLGEQHLAEDHLLLVAARKRAGELVGRLRLDAQERRSSPRPAPSPCARLRKPKREKRGMTASVRFSRTLFDEEEPLAAAVLRHQRDAVAAGQRMARPARRRPACPRARPSPSPCRCRRAPGTARAGHGPAGRRRRAPRLRGDRDRRRARR